jgi:glycosyltransferase involved in cell wall biosynthesis
MRDILYIVVPCYNEEAVIDETTKRLTEKLKNLIITERISEKSRILYVNDGSKDNTWTIIDRLYHENEFVTGLTLSRNRGHQNALLAGLFEAKEHADMIISMDADLQDDIDVIDKL